MTTGDGDDLFFEFSARPIGLPEPAGHDDSPANAALPASVDGLRHGWCRHDHDGEIDRIGRGLDRRVTMLA